MSSLSDRYPMIVRAYQQAEGRTPSDEEILSQTGNGQFAPNDPRIANSVANIVASGQGGTNSSVPLPRGIGTDAEVDQANQFARAQPWYQAMLAQWGQDPSNVRLDSREQELLLDELRQRGIAVSDHFEIDQSGNITPKSGLGKKLLIGAAIGGAALTGLGLAGIGPMAGMFGTGAAAAEAGGVLPSTTIGSGFVPAIAGGTGLTTAGVAGGVAGATGAAGAVGAGALQKVGSALGAKGVGSLLSGIGQGVGSATTAAGNNALEQEKLALDANALNTSGQSAFVNELLSMADTEGAQRKTALRDLYRSSYVDHPSVSPYNPVGAPVLSDQYRTAVKQLGDQGSSMLAKPLAYDVASMPSPSFTPINIKDVQGATNTKPGALQKIGNWVGPALTTTGKILGLFGHGGQG